MKEDFITDGRRRDFLKSVVLGSVAVGATGHSQTSSTPHSVCRKRRPRGNQKMALIQRQPHTVQAAWSKGIERC